MKYELKYEVWTNTEFCLAAFRYPDHAQAYINKYIRTDNSLHLVRVER